MSRVCEAEEGAEEWVVGIHEVAGREGRKGGRKVTSGVEGEWEAGGICELREKVEEEGLGE